MIVRFYALVTFLFISAFSFAQLEPVTPPALAMDKDFRTKIQQQDGKSTPCGVDTLRYSRYNNSNINPQYLNLQPTSGAGMYFAVDDTVWLHGFNYYGYVLNANGFLAAQSVTCKVYYANNNKLPAGVALASGTDNMQALGFNLNQLKQRFEFSSPIMLVSDFVVTIEFAANLSNRVVLCSNDYNAGDGFNKDFSSVKLSGGWSNNLVIGTIPFDADFYFEPVVEYNMSVSYEHGANSCLGNGKPFEFVNTTTFALNPQFSPEAVDTTLDDNFFWNYGDGAPIDTAVHGVHSYTGTLGYFVNLDATFTNWVGSTCQADSTIFLDIGDVQANYTSSNNGLLVNFTDKSVNAERWEWDFDDGTGFSVDQNPTHIYAQNGLYYVKLKARNKGCVDSVTFPLDLTTVGLMNAPAKFDVVVSPNPATNFLNIETNREEADFRWTIYSIQGEEIDRGSGTGNGRIQLNDVGQGVYFLQLESANELITKRFIVQ